MAEQDMHELRGFLRKGAPIPVHLRDLYEASPQHKDDIPIGEEDFGSNEKTKDILHL